MKSNAHIQDLYRFRFDGTDWSIHEAIPLD